MAYRSRKKNYIRANPEDISNAQTLTPVKDVLSKVMNSLNLKEAMQDYEIMQLWDQYIANYGKPKVAAQLQEYTFAHRINKDRSLVIGVRSAVIANELQFIKPKLEEGFIRLLQEQDLKPIKAIVFELRSP